MHELGLTQHVVAIVGERAAFARVKRVTLEIGKLSAVLPEAIRFCFDLCTEGTPLEGAALEILEIEGRGRCEACGALLALDQLYGLCRCGSTRIQCISGTELRVKEFETF
jgi:hydrogenase nickel incorporation protein HypA/HybF